MFNDVYFLYIWDVIRDNEYICEVFEEMMLGIIYINGFVFLFLLFLFCYYNINDIYFYLRNYLLESDILFGIICLEGIKLFDVKIFFLNFFRILMKLIICV